MIHFTWGGVYAGDTSTGLPLREVMLHVGLDTSGQYTSQTEARDSLFRTEVFDWPVGSRIQYWRGFLIPDSLALGIDSTSPEHPILSGPLSDTVFSMKYLVELVHVDDGSIDTLETIVLNPSVGQIPTPGLMSVTNGNLYERDVYLRIVAGDFHGILTSDSLVTFRLESMYGSYPSPILDSLVAYRQARPLMSPDSRGLSLSSPYPDPITVGSSFGASVAFPRGHEIAVSVCDPLGRELSHTGVMSNGDWQRLQFPTPRVAGTYIVKAIAGSDMKIVRLVVLR